MGISLTLKVRVYADDRFFSPKGLLWSRPCLPALGGTLRLQPWKLQKNQVIVVAVELARPFSKVNFATTTTTLGSHLPSNTEIMFRD